MSLVSADSVLDNQDLNQPEDRKRAIYSAFASGDARFDGRVFVGVSSTGIYCRTVCTAKMPRYENCTFFHTAAEAESAGFRPCLTCRPEAAPGYASVDARANLARRAASMLKDECASRLSIEEVAARLGYTGRHLRRAFADEFGVTPLQYVQTCRLLLAKSLLTDTNLPIAAVAEASGFGSVRRFNHAFKERYRLTPSALRKRGHATSAHPGTVTVHLGYRPPYRFDELLGFFRERALEGVEVVDELSYSRTVRLLSPDGSAFQGWIRVTDESAKNRLCLTMSETLLPCVAQIAGRVRRMFDTDCEPRSISEGIASLDEVVLGAVHEGVRLPGCFDAFETACRAILGQQISVKAANKLAARIAEAYGQDLSRVFGAKESLGSTGGLSRAWPTPSEVLELDSIEDAFGELGVIRSRSRTIAQIASLMAAGELDLSAGSIVEKQTARLLDVKGIGPWTAGYIAMRTMGDPDVFLETDAGVAHALPDMSVAERAELAESWRPWRSYAVISLWNSLSSAS